MDRRTPPHHHPAWIGARTLQPPVIKQVEINTISCAFGGLAALPGRLHKFVLERFIPGGAELAGHLYAQSIVFPTFEMWVGGNR
jgi:hypothetical protein